MNGKYIDNKAFNPVQLKMILISLGLIIFSAILPGQVSFETDISEDGMDISNELIGAFFEDINYAADGGIYAELIQNRSFEYFKVRRYVNLEPLHAWNLIEDNGAKASMSIENTSPINKNNLNYLKLEILKSGSAGIMNTGFDGITITGAGNYDYSVYIRSQELYKNPVFLKILSETGELLGADTIRNITTEWKKFEGEIWCKESSGSASFNLTTNGKGVLSFDMVSLFPENTYKKRKNGLRDDLATAIADLQPKFLRFPGGCISHGRGIENAYRWKETIGDVAERKANWNLWGYHQTYGLGFYEYFLFSEDIGAIPLPVVPVGISCQFRDMEIVPLNDMQPWVDDALDLVEFANGDTSSYWGRRRAEMGHPKPFNMEYICLGNEEDDIPEFRERFKMIADSLKTHYPEIKIIGTSGTAAEGGHYDGLWEFSREEELDAVDEHYYVDPTWLLANQHRYDNFDRNGPKVFIGEYASRDDRLANAIAEAAYLTGVERNGDVVQFSCYAPLFSNDNHQQWHPDLIRFDNKQISKTASYYVQQLFSVYSGNKYLSSSVSFLEDIDLFDKLYYGKIGVGSWNTKVQYDDIEIVSGGNVVLSEDFSRSPDNLEELRGTFSVSEGVYEQNSYAQPALSVIGESINTAEYTYTLKAMKTNGNEGFLVVFGLDNPNDYYWLNLGGWNNTRHAIEKVNEHGKATMISVPGSIDSDVWYDIRIEVKKSIANIYLNNDFLFEVPAPSDPISASVVKNEETNEVIIKLVNSSNSEIDVNMNLKGGVVDQQAKVITLSGEPEQKNSLNSPDLLSPMEEFLSITNEFDHKLPAYSIQVFVLRMDGSIGKK